jgi:predicted AAA+ superfamily ATPase
MIKRYLQEQIEKQLYKGKVIILYGARRVGKTILSGQILESQQKHGVKGLYLNCELIKVKQALETTNEQELKDYLGDNRLIVLDEAQNIRNIGLTLKILVDTYPETQIIATGSSSFDLVNNIGEPLVGRSRQFILYPFSMVELKESSDLFKLSSKLDNILRFGTYPGVYGKSEEEAIDELENIASNYLYKDILVFDNIKNSKVLLELLQLLALQIGNEVSYNEIAQKLEISAHTVIKYIDLLEKCFIIFTLRSFSRNLRNEVGRKSKKIYFYDLGIRNALIRAFNPVEMRGDTGGLWENFCVIERLKYNQANKRLVNQYFWRMYSGQEVDYIEEQNEMLNGYEFKYSVGAKVRKPSKFLETYKNTSFQVINSDNWHKFLM